MTDAANNDERFGGRHLLTWVSEIGFVVSQDGVLVLGGSLQRQKRVSGPFCSARCRLLSVYKDGSEGYQGPCENNSPLSVCLEAAHP